MPATRDAILRDIAECDTLDTAKAMMRALLDVVLRTDLAPPLKQVTAQRKVEIRFWHEATEEEDGELQCEEFDPEEVRVQRMEDKFNVDGLAESNWPWLEAMGWRDAPWGEAAAEPPLIFGGCAQISGAGCRRVDAKRWTLTLALNLYQGSLKMLCVNESCIILRTLGTYRCEASLSLLCT